MPGHLQCDFLHFGDDENYDDEDDVFDDHHGCDGDDDDDDFHLSWGSPSFSLTD